MASPGEGAGSPTQSPRRKSARRTVVAQVHSQPTPQRRKQRVARRLNPAVTEDDPEVVFNLAHSPPTPKRRKQRATRRLNPAVTEDDPEISFNLPNSPSRDVSPQPMARTTPDLPPSPDAKTLMKALARALVTKEEQPEPPRRRDDVRLQTYDGKVEFTDYMVQFQAAAKLGGWTDEVKCNKLLGRLSGTALSVGANLPDPTFQQLVDHLMAHFGPRRSGASALSLSTREQARGETLQDFAHSILKLTRQAYPLLDSEAQDQIARTQFIVGCSDANVRQRLREDQPTTLAAALDKARTILEGREAERHRARVLQTCEELEPAQRQPAAPAAQPPAAQPTTAATPEGSSCLQDTLDQLVRVLQVSSGAAAPPSQPSQRPPGGSGDGGRPATVCWTCQQPGHISRNCPHRRPAPGGPRDRPRPRQHQQQQRRRGPALQQQWGAAPQQQWTAPAPAPQWTAPPPRQPAPQPAPQQPWGAAPQQWAAPAPQQPAAQQQTWTPPAQPQPAGPGYDFPAMYGTRTSSQNQGNGSGRQ